MESVAENTERQEAPHSPGAILAAERERQGLARSDIAQRLHMSVSQIEALEAADYGRLPRGTFLRGFMCDFIEKFAPHLTREVMAKAIQCHNKQELEELFDGIELPVH